MAIYFSIRPQTAACFRSEWTGMPLINLSLPPRHNGTAPPLPQSAACVCVCMCVYVCVCVCLMYTGVCGRRSGSVIRARGLKPDPFSGSRLQCPPSAPLVGLDPIALLVGLDPISPLVGLHPITPLVGLDQRFSTGGS